MKRLAIFTVLLVHASAAVADEAAVRRLVQSRAGDQAKIEEIARVPGSSLYEVTLRGPNGPQLLYVDDRARVILVGQLLDGRSGRNLTEERLRRLNPIDWGNLPFDVAITTKRGNGRRKVAVFSDPNCPYCKRFEKDLARLDDVTVYLFLYPVIRPESVPLAKSVWCSPDRAKAWNDLMLRDIEPTAAPNCDTPVERLVALGHSLGATSTPTWFVETGERYSGAIPLEITRRILDDAARAKGAK
ncbi:MAG TPA: DsbC family protein [Burkholderiales bacterium]|nr:DsbC family protein [Burkholderiales bacterium]